MYQPGIVGLFLCQKSWLCLLCRGTSMSLVIRRTCYAVIGIETAICPFQTVARIQRGLQRDDLSTRR